MKKIKQTISGQGYGNCTGACIASLLEIDINDFPVLTDKDNNDWLDKINNVLEKFGYYLLSVSVNSEHILNIKGKFIACVKSLNYENQLHNVIVENGIVIHDPVKSGKSYLNKKIEIKEIDLLVPLFKDKI